MKTAIFFTSRNNYELLDYCWSKRARKCELEILNIDAGSDENQLALGRETCAKNNMHFLCGEKPGLQNDVELACRFFPKAEYLIWFQNDCWPILDSFFPDFCDLVDSGKLSKFGSVGFNVFATDVINNYESGLKQINKGRIPIGILARCPLENRNSEKRPWYCGEGPYALPGLESFKRPFAIESVAWLAIAVK